MASKLFSGGVPLLLPPPHLLLFELLVSSATIGFTSPKSLVRPAALPVLGACVYAIVRTSPQGMRAPWASLLGGFSFALLLQYVDLAIVTKRSHPPSTAIARREEEETPPSLRDRIQSAWDRIKSAAERFAFGWNAMWAYRGVDTPLEAKNVPLFDAEDPSQVPSRSRFLIRNAASAALCYLVLDLLAQPTPPLNLAPFHPSFVPLLARWDAVTPAELKVRFLSIAAFAATFYCVIQGLTSAAATLAVGLRLSDVRSWRPAFGSPADAYSLKTVWGKFWHQLLRKPLTDISSVLVHDFLRGKRGSAVTGSATVLSTFALSGVLHSAAGVASGMPLQELGVFRFFLTQAFGLLLEQSVVSLYRRAYQRFRARFPSASGEEENESSGPNWAWRVLGFVWVAAFMTWSGPAWSYPMTYRQAQQGSASLLPFSVVKWVVPFIPAWLSSLVYRKTPQGSASILPSSVAQWFQAEKQVPRANASIPRSARSASTPPFSIGDWFQSLGK